MEQIEVEITGMVITQRYGTLNTGDILRTDAAYAKHLIEEAHGARYTSRETNAPEIPARRTARTTANKKAPEPSNKADAESPSLTGAAPDADADAAAAHGVDTPVDPAPDQGPGHAPDA